MSTFGIITPNGGFGGPPRNEALMKNLRKYQFTKSLFDFTSTFPLYTLTVTFRKGTKYHAELPSLLRQRLSPLVIAFWLRICNSPSGVLHAHGWAQLKSVRHKGPVKGTLKKHYGFAQLIHSQSMTDEWVDRNGKICSYENWFCYCFEKHNIGLSEICKNPNIDIQHAPLFKSTTSS